MIFKKEQIDYYKNKAFVLSKTFDQQYQELYKLGDYATDDIANDWMLEDVPFLEKMVKHGVVGDMAAELYKEILKNFSNASLGEQFYDDVIWTLEGLRSHDFWNHQRTLAKKLLIELENVVD